MVTVSTATADLLRRARALIDAALDRAIEMAERG